jgi:predicted metal-binding protein
MNDLKAHLFICVNDRGEGKKESCARKGGQQLKDEVKKLCHERGLPKDLYRVNNSGCLGPCERGISAVIYPAGDWLLDNTPADAVKLADLVEKAVRGSGT